MHFLMFKLAFEAFGEGKGDPSVEGTLDVLSAVWVASSSVLFAICCSPDEVASSPVMMQGGLGSALEACLLLIPGTTN